VILARGLAEEMVKPKYARLELERRWLVDGDARPPLKGGYGTLIEDRYILGSRIRLRRMSRPDLRQTTWKLTKKYEAIDPAARPIVTTYLTEAEFDLLRTLPAHDLVKRRYHLSMEDSGWSIDLFEGPLQGLETIECEAGDRATLDALRPPHWALHEITGLPHWQCGALAAAQTRPE